MLFNLPTAVAAAAQLPTTAPVACPIADGFTAAPPTTLAAALAAAPDIAATAMDSAPLKTLNYFFGRVFL